MLPEQSMCLPNSLHSACLVCKGKIIATATNEYGEDPFKPSYASTKGGYVTCTVHAECNVLQKASKKNKFPMFNTEGEIKSKFTNPSNFDMIVIRRNKNSKLMLSKPCEDCISLMKHFGLKRVFYSTDAGDIVCEKVSSIENKKSSGRI